MSTLVMFMSSSSLSSCRRTSVRATRVNTCHVHVVVTCRRTSVRATRVHVHVVISVLLQTNECESDPCQHMSSLSCSCSSSSLSSCRRTSVRATRVNTCHVHVHVVVISVLLQTNECESDPCQHLSCSCSCRRHLCPLADERV